MYDVCILWVSVGRLISVYFLALNATFLPDTGSCMSRDPTCSYGSEPYFYLSISVYLAA